MREQFQIVRRGATRTRFGCAQSSAPEVACARDLLPDRGLVSSAPDITAALPGTEDPDYKSIALLSACHFSDDINQGVVPAMLPFLIAAKITT